MTSQHPDFASMQNPSAVLFAAGDLRYEDREVPELKEGEVLVRIEFVGVCGSDVRNNSFFFLLIRLQTRKKSKANRILK